MDVKLELQQLEMTREECMKVVLDWAQCDEDARQALLAIADFAAMKRVGPVPRQGQSVLA